MLPRPMLRGSGSPEMIEGVIDDAWVARKQKWAAYRDHPVSFALVWGKE